MNLRTLHRINRLLTPLIDLVVVVLVCTTGYALVVWFFDYLVPALTR